MREANANSLRRDACHDVCHGQDSDEDRGGLLALHARRFDTGWRMSGNGMQIPAASGKISFTVGPREKTLKAIAYKPGLTDSSIAEATYVYESPY